MLIAANQLELSEQVPSQVVVLTDSTPRRVSLGKLTLQFRHAAPRNLLGAGKPAGMVIQALRHLKKVELPAETVNPLRRQLDSPTEQHFSKLASDLPAWMRPIINRFAEPS